jgi:hypothetical protein
MSRILRPLNGACALRATKVVTDGLGVKYDDCTSPLLVEEELKLALEPKLRCALLLLSGCAEYKVRNGAVKLLLPTIDACRCGGQAEKEIDDELIRYLPVSGHSARKKKKSTETVFFLSLFWLCARFGDVLL